MAETVGLIGLGNMGVPMALNLMRGGYEVRVYNRTAAKSQPLIEQGAKLAAQASDVAVRGGVVFPVAKRGPGCSGRSRDNCGCRRAAGASSARA